MYWSLPRKAIVALKMEINNEYLQCIVECFLCLWFEVLVGNNTFLFGNITANFKDLHAVKKRCWDHVKVVG
jgi:hypothetical protein